MSTSEKPKGSPRRPPNAKSKPSAPPHDRLAEYAASANLPPTALRSFSDWLAEQLVADEFAKLGQGGHTETRVPLRRVFVDLPIVKYPNSDPTNNPSSELFLERLLDAKPCSLSLLCRPPELLGASSVDASMVETDLVQSRSDEVRRGGEKVLRAFERAGTLLIGGPGQGKSTLGQLACQLHRAALLKPRAAELTTNVRDVLHPFEEQGLQSTNAKGLTLPIAPIFPLRVILPDAAAWLAKQPKSQDVGAKAPVLLRFLAAQPSARKTKLEAEALAALLTTMPFLLLLDGFDEVGAVEDRELVVTATRELLTALGQKDAHAIVIATTRPQGYAGELSRIGIPLTTRYLAHLSPKNALGYAKKLVEAKIQGADEQEKILERLREATREPSTSRLLQTPLQVTILAALVQQGRAPSERWKLFWSYFDFAYRREIERETYASKLLADLRGHIQAIHMRVALLLQVEGESAGGAAARMSRDRLQSIVDAVLKEDEVTDEDRVDLVQRIVDAAEKRLVFLVEPEPGHFGFEIRSLQEFMAAWALAEGRDSFVESRIVQVAKAPLFRNVALFMASKLFSERSALRDMLADRVCGALDDDPSDALARATKAGARLALDVLDEGSSFTQPKRTRALMERAVGLLELPPSADHGRLAYVANDDSVPILRDALETRLARGATDETIDTLSAWVCIVEARNFGYRWAQEIGETFWSSLKAPTAVFSACEEAGIPLGRWIVPKIEAAPELFAPENVLHFGTIGRRGTKSTAAGWLDWLVRELRFQRPETIRSRDVRFNFAPLRSEAAAPLPMNVVEAMNRLPLNWRAWMAAAKFINAPSAAVLSEALRRAAEGLSREKWLELSGYMPWPMAACLKAAGSTDDLHRFSEMLSRGELGDSVDWYAAERSWHNGGSLRSAIDALADGLPWKLEWLAVAPPLVASGFGYAHGRASKDVEALMRHVAGAFNTCRSLPHRAALADICLSLMWYLPTGSKPDLVEVGEWLKVVDGGFRLPLARFKQIPISEWFRVFEGIGPRRTFDYSMAVSVAAQAYIQNPANLWLLYQVATAVSHEAATELSNDLRAHLIAVVGKQTYATAPAHADVAVLRIWLGALTDADIPALLHNVAVYAERKPSVWGTCLSAILNGDSSDAVRTSLLSQCYSIMGSRHRHAPSVMWAMQRVLQSRKSDLGSPVVWDRLALPLPHPSMPTDPSHRRTLPSQPVVLRELHVQHIRGLIDLKMSFDPPTEDRGQWILILGPNGSGKTTLLRSLALALRNLSDPRIWPKGTFAVQWKNVEELGEAKVRIKLADYGEQTTLIRVNGSDSFLQTPRQDKPVLFPIFGYGCRRGSAMGGTSREVYLGEDDGPEVATLFGESASLIHAETWLLRWDGDAQRSALSNIIFKSVCDSLKSLLAVRAIEVHEQKVWVSERDGLSLPLSSLSDGYLTVAGWFIDLVARWIALAERHGVPVGANFLEHMTGLVLIDEIDLHLHPRWQIEVIERTRRLLPKMSFVVTTHNPLTLVGAKPEEIWILSFDKGRVRAERGIETPLLLSGGQLYSRYFGIQDIYPHELGKKLQRYGFLSGYVHRNEAEQMEMKTLRDDLRRAGIDPGWDEVESVDQ